MIDYDRKIKVLLIGEMAVGKTSIMYRYTQARFEENVKSTIGLDFTERVVSHSSGNVKIQIWDTAGQERFRSITQTYFRGCDAVILVYDCSQFSSFENIQYWVDEIKNKSEQNTLKIIVGNKCDTVDKSVDPNLARNLAEDLQMPFFEASAKADYNIDQIFEFILAEDLKKQKKSRNTVSINKKTYQDKKEKGKSKCCLWN